MSHLVTRVVSHKYQVCSLYKRALRNLESWCRERDYYRICAVQMRQRFEENKNVKDIQTAVELLKKGEAELFKKQHYQPIKFPYSPGGVAYDREAHMQDYVLDYWHPYEKAQYPKYFARREQRKIEYIQRYEKEYGKPDPNAAHH